MRVTSFILLLLLCGGGVAFAQNPLIVDQFTADPTARVFDGRVYVYPSHDVNCGTNWFCMKDYHVFSSENLVDWTDHGVIVRQEDVPWVDSNTNSLWAPDTYEKDGTYYFYFPAIVNQQTGMRGMGIGVATSDTPDGPFTPKPMPIAGVHGIDPNVFIDHDGQAYLYWAGGGSLRGARLKENMLEIDGEPQSFPFPDGMKEGPFLFERDGIYYMTFPRVIEKTEALVYAIGDSPLGPFEYKGTIMAEHPSGCWTNHHSIIEYDGQWYLFYHHNDLSPAFDKNRSIRADSLFFSADGAIRKVTPTLRGVGLVPATNQIQIDRFSAISEDGASVAFIDTSNTFAGWKTVLESPDGWVRFDAVDFGERSVENVVVQARSSAGGTVRLRIGDSNSALIRIPASEDWTPVRAHVDGALAGVQNVALSLDGAGPVEVDWIRFE